MQDGQARQASLRFPASEDSATDRIGVVTSKATRNRGRYSLGMSSVQVNWEGGSCRSPCLFAIGLSAIGPRRIFFAYCGTIDVAIHEANRR